MIAAMYGPGERLLTRAPLYRSMPLALLLAMPGLVLGQGRLRISGGVQESQVVQRDGGSASILITGESDGDGAMMGSGWRPVPDRGAAGQRRGGGGSGLRGRYLGTGGAIEHGGARADGQAGAAA
ncbi:MAG: hypothetical protein JNL62_06745 [Bryobacterales bacterium]|nr:hypothetical protein [Bryobacterales bacterium]